MNLWLFNKKLFALMAMASMFCFSAVNAQSARYADIKFLTDTSLNFNSLISQFNGKIVYVDIWATWCSPCRHELQQTKDVKAFADFARKNDIVVLYICADNNTKAWKQFVNSNSPSGYHTMAGKAMINDFRTTFSSVQRRSGVMKRSFYIPRHLIIDRSGSVIDSSANSQGSTVVYQQLNKLLGKERS